MRRDCPLPMLRECFVEVDEENDECLVEWVGHPNSVDFTWQSAEGLRLDFGVEGFEQYMQEYRSRKAKRIVNFDEENDLCLVEWEGNLSSEDFTWHAAVRQSPRMIYGWTLGL
eukprot:gb/GECG01013564.1/.p1 GENE.gb/GECG01013564.1/~~gb/GECG01013564.1/.p1  ORF type:complete len:113 (+),score=10.64 gb/GECG01013564.1/:1-339(+)